MRTAPAGSTLAPLLIRSSRQPKGNRHEVLQGDQCDSTPALGRSVDVIYLGFDAGTGVPQQPLSLRHPGCAVLDAYTKKDEFMPPRSKKLLFVVTEDWYFCSHRLSLARAARQAGYQVVVATRVNAHRQAILDEGFTLIPLSMQRAGKNLWKELQAIKELAHIYHAEKPDIVHHVAIKPVLYGSIAACFTRVKGRVNALGGLGYVFISKDWKARCIRRCIILAYQFLFRYPRMRLILQNRDDCEVLLQSGALREEQIVLIRGVGVNLATYHPVPTPPGVPVILLASRMLWDKGIGEFVAAARLLQAAGIQARFRLVGATDVANPSSIPEAQLSDWHHSGVIEWTGHVADMTTEFAGAHIVCLPSYREGVPKVLLEAAACALPIVTTDAPGCREVVHHGENGFLVPVKDAQALAAVLTTLVQDQGLRERMGKRGRELMEAEFSEEQVIQTTMAVYRDL